MGFEWVRGKQKSKNLRHGVLKKTRFVIAGFEGGAKGYSSKIEGSFYKIWKGPQNRFSPRASRMEHRPANSLILA